jgi:hypothetical protein
VRSGEKPVNPLIFLFAGVLVVAGIVGVIVVSAGRGKKVKAEAQLRELTRIQDSVRAVNRARRDTVKVAAQTGAAAVLADEIDKLDQRFSLVRQQVIKDQPSPAQAKLVAQIRDQIVRLRQLAATVTNQPGSGPDSTRSLIRDNERIVRDLISDLSRAPKK